MRKAIVAFTKIPEEGKSKTRLTESRGGFFTPQEANVLYEAMILDVIDCCIEAAGSEHKFWICHDKDGDSQRFRDFLRKNVREFTKISGIYCDEGGSFDECMQFAADYMFSEGVEQRIADGIIIVGGDLPTMQPGSLKAALQKLESLSAVRENGRPGSAMVAAACQDGGFSLVGYTYATPFNFNGVFYNTDGLTALDVLVDKAAKASIPFGIVEAMADIDVPNDLGSMIPVLRALELAAAYDTSIMTPERTLSVIREMGLTAVTPGKEL